MTTETEAEKLERYYLGQMHPIEELTPEQQDELYCMFEGMSKCDAINTLLAWLEHSQLAELLEGIEQARRDCEALDAGG